MPTGDGKKKGSAWQKLTGTGPYAKPKNDWRGKQAAQAQANAQLRSQKYVASLPTTVQQQLSGSSIEPVYSTAKKKVSVQADMSPISGKTTTTKSKPVAPKSRKAKKPRSGGEIADYLGLGANSAVRTRLRGKGSTGKNNA